MKPVQRLRERTAGIRQRGGKALVAFFTAGYPDAEGFLELVRAADEAGADVIEIGVPFSDPIADGPVVQASSAAALAGGMTLGGALDLAASVRSDVGAALVVMSYINPILAMGLDAFASRAHAAGIGGVILPDVSLEESDAPRAALASADIDYVHLLAPTSSDGRIATAAATAAGFLYLVSVTGVTGAREQLDNDITGFVRRVREHSQVPAYVGFGVSTPEMAARVAADADGVIIGSRLIRLVEEGDRTGAPGRVGAFLRSARAAIDAG
jgi:tryptophan synthase alpha chain